LVLTSPIVVGVSITGTSPGPFTLDSTVFAFPIIGTGATASNPVIYRYTDFLIEVWRKIRQWIFDAGVAFGLVPVGTVADVQFSLSVTYPNDQNDSYHDAVRINLSIPQLGLGFVGATITAMSCLGLPTSSRWGHLLGLYQENAASNVFTLASGVFTRAGQFQPRHLAVLLRSEQDSGEYEERQDYRTSVLGSGRVIQHNYGFAEVRRDLRLVSLHPFELAPQFHVGALSSIDVTRTRLFFPNPIVSGSGGSGVSGIGSTPTGLQTDRVAIGDILRISEQWVSRVRLVTIPAPPAPIDVTLWEIVPSNINPPLGAPIYKVSEVHSFVLESLRLQGLFVYDVDDVSGEWRPSGPRYHMRGAGKLLLQFDRQQPQAADRYAFSLNLVRNSAPGLVEVA
jgi:hypothetical protein